MKNIKFLKNSGPYSPGDVAGFDDQVADAYVALGAAEPVAVAEPAPVEVAPDDSQSQALAQAAATAVIDVPTSKKPKK